MSAATIVQPQSGDDLAERLRQATLGRYDIYAELGRGGMAAVFLALDLALNRKVALKVMLPELMQGHGAHERFRREARTAASLSHPHIIPVYAVGEDDGLAWFAMKYVDGRPLDSVLAEEGAQSPAFVQTMLRQVASALEYAHRRGVVHRDIKPANILLDEGGWFILTDFGIAKATDDVGLTSSGMLIGTPAYMSPEHFEGKPVNAAADQYALGCVAYELLAGARPFACATVAELMRAHMLDEPLPIAQLRQDCPPTLAAVISRAMQKDPGRRFASADDLVHALEAPSGDEQRLVTAQIATLARSGAERRPRISQPVSPVPLNRERVTTSDHSQGVESGRAHYGRILGGALVVGIAAFWSLWPRTKDESAPSSVAAVAPSTPEPSAAASPPPLTEARRAGTTDTLVPRARDLASPKPDRRVSMLSAPERPPIQTRGDSSVERRPGTAPASTSPDERGADVIVVPTDSGALHTDTPVPPPSQAWFSIKLLFRDLTLYVDNQLMRVAKQRTVIVAVSPGRHTIEVRRNECPTPFVDVREFVAGDTVRYNNKGPCPEGM